MIDSIRPDIQAVQDDTWAATYNIWTDNSDGKMVRDKEKKQVSKLFVRWLICWLERTTVSFTFEIKTQQYYIGRKNQEFQKYKIFRTQIYNFFN